MRIELTTSSLPRKCSTPELQRLVHSSPSAHRPSRLKSPALSYPAPPHFRTEDKKSVLKFRHLLSGPRPMALGHPRLSWSGRRGSNPRPTAWKAVALPTELLPHETFLKRTWAHFTATPLRRGSQIIELVGREGFEPSNS